MATHRPHDTTFAPDFEFQVALGVLEASEDLAARRRPLTPTTLARALRAKSFPARPTLAQIERGLAQVQHWRTQILTRDLLQHRRQLVALSARIETQQRSLGEDLVYLTRMRRETDALLQSTLLSPSGSEPAPARSSGSAGQPPR